MRTLKKATLFVALLAVGAGCADLDVVNQNSPDAARALATPGDVESLIAGSYRQWWDIQSSYLSTGMIMSNVSFQHSAYPANFGMVEYSKFPRIPLINSTANSFYSYISYPWTKNYRGLAAIRDGLIAIDGGVDLGADEPRARAYAKFVQGLSHGNLAMAFDQAFIVDETVDITQPLEPQDYNAVAAAAIGYLDEAIALSSGQSFIIPSQWMSVDVPAAQLARLASFYKARLRASVARTPAERAAVNWQAVLSDIDAAITDDWEMNLDYTNWWSGALYYSHLFGWGQMSYFVNGMADQSGNYQIWEGISPVDAKHPVLPNGDPFLIITPDQRYPQGATLEAQIANDGTKYEIRSNYGSAWGRPDRGTYRWSYYRDKERDVWSRDDGPQAVFTIAEMDLLAAEAHLRAGNAAQAATLVNKYRTAAGLNATDASGTNTSCVPKLPSGACGDLMEMLKWEKRHATHHDGEMQVSWYFDGRGWGDLYEGSFLHLPVPAQDAQVLGLSVYTFGGVGGTDASTGSSYGWEN